MSELPYPPRAAVRILRLLIRGSSASASRSNAPESGDRPDAEQIEANLVELFRRRAGRDGLLSARLWYWRQVLGFALRRRALRSRGSAEQGPAAAGSGGAGTRPGGPATQPKRAAARSVGTTAPAYARSTPAVWIHEWTSDLRCGARSLRHQPGFAIIAVGALAIGIAVNAIGFAVLDAAL